jgi:HEAT repeat protein
MNKPVIAYSLLFALLFSFAFTLANTPSETKYTTFETNLLVGLSSDNQGVRISSAYFLGEMKSEKAIIPLMDILHSSENNASRQVAALALYKINSERGIFAIKRAIQFDNDAQTRKLCKIFYNQHLVREREGTVEVEPIMATKLDLQYGGYKLSDFEGNILGSK